MRALLSLLLSAAAASSATLTWDALPASSGVVGYDVHYGPVAASPASKVTLGKVTTAQLSPAGTNYFRVTGRDGAGTNSQPSNQVVWPAATPTPTPSPPVLGFSLSWGAVQYATFYRVYENSIQIAEIPGLTYSLAGKVGPKTYTVRAVGASGMSAPSNSVTLPAPTPVPTPTPVPIPSPPVLQLKQG